MAKDQADPRPVVGPILFFRGTQGDRWRLSALFVLDGSAEPFDLQVDAVSMPVPPRHLAGWRSLHVWRFDFAVTRGERDTPVRYGFGTGDGWQTMVPGRNMRPRIAFVSGGGAGHLAGARRARGGAHERWVDLLRWHDTQSLHLLIHGGDQIYADDLWDRVPALEPFLAQPVPQRFIMRFNRAMADQLMDFYFRLYCQTWAQPESARVLARIPSIMIWDDHDIFDGWGSHSDVAQASHVSRGIFQVARRHFSLFQLGAALREPPETVWGAVNDTFAQGFVLGDLGILVPDLRSERTQKQIFGPATWEALPRWVWQFNGCKQLLVVSSVPLAFLNVAWLEIGLRLWPRRTALEDDCRDQWRSPRHVQEWLRLVGVLGDFALRSRCRVTVLSGDIHLGGRGVVRGGGGELSQLISSSIVHPPPSRPATWLAERLARSPETVGDDNSTVELLEFPELGRRFLRARNWLDLNFDRQSRLVARWHAAGRAEPLTMIY